LGGQKTPLDEPSFKQIKKQNKKEKKIRGGDRVHIYMVVGGVVSGQLGDRGPAKAKKRFLQPGTNKKKGGKKKKKKGGPETAKKMKPLLLTKPRSHAKHCCRTIIAKL